MIADQVLQIISLGKEKYSFELNNSVMKYVANLPVHESSEKLKELAKKYEQWILVFRIMNSFCINTLPLK